MLRTGPVVIVRRGEDRYRRTLARLSVGARDVGQVLIDESLALPWNARNSREARMQHWCASPRRR
jgi:micrococcal nuclease